MKDEPVITKGAFDSQNLAFWDTTRNRYTCFSRIFSNKVRAVQSNTSPDFLTWSEPRAASLRRRRADGALLHLRHRALPHRAASCSSPFRSAS